jgi:hypothetical protein
MQELFLVDTVPVQGPGSLQSSLFRNNWKYTEIHVACGSYVNVFMVEMTRKDLSVNLSLCECCSGSLAES